ncbi:MAG: RNA 2',3'-cyclic phosphodiesterase [Spirochaetales bacterium]|nr:RNA 2',3'-cyclic phosphodiesterase [Spirochaetales bacterium]
MRAFLAIPISEELRSSLHAQIGDLKKQYPMCKWVDMRNYHITSLFLGTLETEQVKKVCNALEAMCLSCGGDISLDRLNCFPNCSRPATIVAGLHDSSEITLKVYGEVSRVFSAYADRRKYSPHITLARVRRGSRVRNFEPPGIGPFGKFTVERLVLYESRLEAGGAVYSEVHSVPISPGNGALQ